MVWQQAVSITKTQGGAALWEAVSSEQWAEQAWPRRPTERRRSL